MGATGLSVTTVGAIFLATSSWVASLNTEDDLCHVRRDRALLHTSVVITSGSAVELSLWLYTAG